MPRHRKPRKWLLLPLVAVVLLPAGASRIDAKGDINFVLGLKSIEDFEDLGDLENQGELGVEMTFSGADWPLGIAVDLLVSGAEDEFEFLTYDFDIEASTAEIDLGVRKIWEVAGKPVRPYVGGGLALISAELDASGPTPLFAEEEDDNGTGIWLGGGVFWRIGPSFNIGLNLRYSSADVDLFGEELDAGGLHAGFLLGFGW